MKHLNILRVMGVTAILAILMLAIPASPALAETISISPAQGKIGDNITISGGGFTPSTTQDRYVDIYFSSNPATTGQVIGTAVTTYYKSGGRWVDEQGAVNAT